MITYPYQLDREGLPLEPKTQESADKLEKHINELLKAQTRPVQTYFFAQIALELDMSVEFVRAIGIDGGHNGFMAHRSDMTLAQADAAAASGSGCGC